MKRTILIAATLLLTFVTSAQAPQMLNYQSVIRDANQDLVGNQLVTTQISIVQGSAVGTSVYIEEHSQMTNVNGLISLEIGNGTVLTGNFSTIDWSNGPYFIKTEVDPLGGTNFTIVATSQMASVPYALYAETSGTPGPSGADGTDGADGLSAYQIAVNNGFVGSESAWLFSLKGGDGATGPMGPQGLQGLQGPAGNDGIDGISGVDGVDGAVGPQGVQGPAGPIAGSNQQINFNNNGNAGADAEFVYDLTSNHMAIGTSTINPSAALEINSTTGALLLPRLTTVQRNALTAADGMIVFNTNARKMQAFVSGGNASSGNIVATGYFASDSIQGNSFAVENTGILSTISLTILNPISNPIPGTTSYTMNVYDSHGHAVIASATNTLTATPGNSVSGSFDFSAASLLLESGSNRYFEITSDNGSVFQVQASDNDDYVFGEMYVEGDFEANYDMTFTITTVTNDEWVNLH